MPTTTPEREKELARGETYSVDAAAPEKATREHLFKSPTGVRDVLDWAKCQADPEAGDAKGHIVNHFNFCRWGYNTATALDGNGRPVGTFRVRETEISEGSKANRNASISVKLDAATETGVFATPAARVTWEPTAASPTAPGGCTVANMPPGQGGTPKPTAAFHGTGVAATYDLTSAKGAGKRIDDATLCVYRSQFLATSGTHTTGWWGAPDNAVRFDSGEYLAPYGTKGAIFSRVIPSFHYDRTNTDVKAVAKHVFDALHAPQLTYPKKTDKDIPGYIWRGDKPLHRNYPKFDSASADVTKKNEAAKNAACAGLSHNTGEQCDEFPFASTKEGAGKGDGNFSVKYVPQSDNSKAGGALSKWYGQDRILDGDAYGRSTLTSRQSTAVDFCARAEQALAQLRIE